MPAGGVAFGGGLDAAAALAGQVAHDIGNVLTVVLGNAEILSDALAGDPALAELAARILRAAQRGIALVDRLDQLARNPPSVAEPTDAAALVAGLAGDLEGALPPGITLETRVSPDSGHVALPAELLAAALDELVENALNALGGQGRLRIRCGPAPGPTGRVTITVWDDGPGMSADMLGACVAPGFRSGTAGHRAGLGLAVAARVAEFVGGRLLLDSSPGGGTRAILDLPTVPASPTPGP